MFLFAYDDHNCKLDLKKIARYFIGGLDILLGF